MSRKTKAIAVESELTGDMGTFGKPGHPVIRAQTLLVNGVPVVAEGELITDAVPGQPIRRAPRSS